MLDELQRILDREFIAAKGRFEYAEIVQLDLRTDADQVDGLEIILRGPVAPEDARDMGAVPDRRPLIVPVVRNADEGGHDAPIDLASSAGADAQVFELLLVVVGDV